MNELLLLYWMTLAGAPAVLPVPAEPAAVPYAVGERASYGVHWGMVGRVGTATLGVGAMDTVRGRPAYRVTHTLRGRLFLARVDNRLESWVDASGGYAHRFEQWTHEASFRRRRTREFYPTLLRWAGQTNGRPESGTLTTAEPLDDLSFLFFVRTLDLEVGQEYTFDRYWNPGGNPVRIRVLRRERVTVPAGTFDTLVLQPTIRTSGLFSEGGAALVYIADGGARQVVMLKARSSIGSLQMQLEQFQGGAGS
jgi:hypothetical protein